MGRLALPTLALVLALVVVGVASHGLMVSPAPRKGTTNAGDAKGAGKGPCGAGALQTKGAISATYTAG
jgi:hypothetical protein